MAKLTRTQKYADLRKQMEEVTDSQLNDSLVDGYVNRLDNIDKSISKDLDVKPDGITGIRTKEYEINDIDTMTLENTEEKVVVSGTKTNYKNAIDSYLDEVKSYNLEKNRDMLVETQEDIYRRIKDQNHNRAFGIPVTDLNKIEVAEPKESNEEIEKEFSYEDYWNEINNDSSDSYEIKGNIEETFKNITDLDVLLNGDFSNDENLPDEDYVRQQFTDSFNVIKDEGSVEKVVIEEPKYEFININDQELVEEKEEFVEETKVIDINEELVEETYEEEIASDTDEVADEKVVESTEQVFVQETNEQEIVDVQNAYPNNEENVKESDDTILPTYEDQIFSMYDTSAFDQNNIYETQENGLEDNVRSNDEIIDDLVSTDSGVQEDEDINTTIESVEEILEAEADIEQSQEEVKEIIDETEEFTLNKEAKVEEKEEFIENSFEEILEANNLNEDLDDENEDIDETDIFVPVIKKESTITKENEDDESYEDDEDDEHPSNKIINIVLIVFIILLLCVLGFVFVYILQQRGIL